jgi:hypothetical protein
MTPQQSAAEPQKAIRVFISYSWTSPEHKEWVLQLAVRLRNFGFESILDQWHLQEGQDKYAFMESMTTDPSIKKVIVICDEGYASKADYRKSGVGIESTLISQEVYGKVDQRKFIPLVTQRDKEGTAHLPAFLKSRIYIDFSDATKFEERFIDLMRALAEKPENVAPPVGELPAFLRDETPNSNPLTSYKLSAAQNAIVADKNTAPGLVEDYLAALIEALQSLTVEEEQYEKPKRDELLMTGLEKWTPFRDEFIGFIRTLTRYGGSARSFEALPRFFEKALPLTLDPRKSGVTDHIRFAIYEAFLYAFTIFLKADRFAEAAILLSSYYRENGELAQRFPIFLARLHRLESAFQSQSNIREGCLLGYVLQQRATHPDVTFASLQEPDLLLFLRYAIETQLQLRAGMLSWTPYTWPYLNHELESNFGFEFLLSGLDFARRARSRRYFESFKTILGVESKEDLLQKWQPLVASGAGLISFHGEAKLDADKVRRIFEGFALEA